MNKNLAAAFVMTLSRWPCDLLAALNLGIGWGNVPAENKAFARGVEDGLLKKSGQPTDQEALAAALDLEINGRVDAGTWA